MHEIAPERGGSQGQERVTAVFWTGGWDSTFRILDLVIHYGCTVQPIYVVDEYRKSNPNERAATERVRSELERRFPEKSHLLLESIVVHRSKLVISEQIKAQFAALRSVFEIGWQYEWLSAAVEQSTFDRVEVAFHADDNPQIYQFLHTRVEKVAYPCGAPTWELQHWHATNAYEENMKLFLHFSYPTLLMAKQDMDPIATEYGFADMLELTWFCHYPWGNQPCGACSVCRHYVGAGFTQRFPKSALLRNKVWFIIHPARLLIANPDRFVQRLRDKATWLTANTR